MKISYYLVGLLLAYNFSFCQPMTERYKSFGEVIIANFPSAPFPHSQRENGHEYNGKKYPADQNYNDNSVMIFFPNNFTPHEKNNFVVYVHGWYNNIDSACAQFKLIEQFADSKVNAIFVFPEGPKNAPDSFGGKLEDKDGLKNLLSDVTAYLISVKKISAEKIGKIILAGHSGAYRALAFSLMRGGLIENISDVILFDALYAHTEKFAYWIDNYSGRFINIYTEDGGTKNESLNLIQDLDGWGKNFLHIEETALQSNDLSENKIIFIHTELTHNEVISKRNQFQKFLSTSALEKMKE